MSRGLDNKEEGNISGKPVHPLMKGKGSRGEDCVVFVFVFLASPLPLLPAWSEKEMLRNVGVHPATLKRKSPMLG